MCLLIGYVCGCMLTADLVSQRMAHKPVFELGDGNPGMANVGHCLGFRAAVYTLAGDILKVVAAAIVSIVLFPGMGNIAMAWAGLGATIGHNYPFWHDFRGGKGVTTTCSAIILGSPIWGGLASILGLVAVIASEYLCVGAVAIPAFFLLFMLIGGNPDLIAVAAILLILMIPQHWPAIRDISSGRTPKASIAKKVRDRFKGGRAEVEDLDRTAIWPAQPAMQTIDASAGESGQRDRVPQHATGRQGTRNVSTSFSRTNRARTSQTRWPQQSEWRNASPLDRMLPLFENDDKPKWRPRVDSTAVSSTARNKKATQGREGYRQNKRLNMAGVSRQTLEDRYDNSPEATHNDSSVSETEQNEQPKVIKPGSTAQMVIPKVSAPLDESNPLQQALLQARKHQEERRAAAIAEAERQRAEEEAKRKERPRPTKRLGHITDVTGLRGNHGMQFGN